MAVRADDFILENSYPMQEDEFSIENKQYYYVNDQNNGSYPTGQVLLDLSSLTNSGKFLDWSQSFLAVPLVMTVNSSAGTLDAAVQNAFAASLKNGYHHLLNSMQVQISNNDCVQTQNYNNLKVNYELLESLTNDDIQNFGKVFSFYGVEDWKSFSYQPAASQFGLGECNNSIVPSSNTTNWSPVNGYLSYNNGCTTRRQRMEESTSFDPSNTTNASILNYTSSNYLNTVGKNYVSQSNNSTTVVYYIMAILPLSILHDLFRKLHITKNMYIKMTLNLNTQCYSNLTGISGQAFYSAISTVSQFQTLPCQLSPISTGTTSVTSQGLVLTAATGQSLQIALGIVAM